MSSADFYLVCEASTKNIYEFSGKLYDESDDYTFDTTGNVTSYINDCLGSSYQTTEQKYTYDALYQLIKVEGECKYSSLKDNYAERDDTYSQVFTYDNIGNLIRKTSQDSGVSGKHTLIIFHTIWNMTIILTMLIV